MKTKEEIKEYIDKLVENGFNKVTEPSSLEFLIIFQEWVDSFFDTITDENTQEKYEEFNRHMERLQKKMKDGSPRL